MDKKLGCRDLGVDCDYTVCARTAEEVLKKVADHAQTYHHMSGFSQEMYEKARAAIHDGDCECDACFESCCC
jgi:predicted small metal-binding protein